MKLTQTIIAHIGEITTGHGKNGTCSKRQIVLQQSGEYKRMMAVQLWGKLCDIPLELNWEVEAEVDIESREYNGRWYTDVKCWKLSKKMSNGDLVDMSSGDVGVSRQAPAVSAEQVSSNSSAPDDLPF